MTMTIPVIPPLPAGYVVQLSDMQALASAATFLLTKPMARVRDTTGGVAIAATPTIVTYSVADFDPDGMWAVGTPNRLTIQTPGWYKVRHMTSIGGGGSNTYVSWVISTTGANNPAGAGITSSPYWSGYSDAQTGGFSPRPGGGGIWPAYLYAGDYIQVQAEGSATGGSTATTEPGGATLSGSLLSLEYVST